LFREDRAVLPTPPPFEPLRFSLNRATEVLHRPVYVDEPGRREYIGRLSDQLLALVSVGLEHRLVHIQEAAIEVLDVNGLGEIVEESAVALLARAEGRLRLDPLRNIHERSGEGRFAVVDELLGGE